MTTNANAVNETQARETLHWLDAADETERGWWYRRHDGALEIVTSGRLDADSTIDDVIDAMRVSRLIATTIENITDEQIAALRDETLPPFNGPPHYNAAQRKLYRMMRANYPDAYITPGLGWCGPDWEKVKAEEERIDAMRTPTAKTGDIVHVAHETGDVSRCAFVEPGTGRRNYRIKRRESDWCVVRVLDGADAGDEMVVRVDRLCADAIGAAMLAVALRQGDVT